MSFDPFQGRPRLRRALPWIAWAAAVVFIVYNRASLSLGTVSPAVADAETASLIPSRSARVVAVLKQPGDQVVAGDVVVVLEAVELSGELAVARAELVALESGVTATALDVKEADREVVARLGQDLERAAIDAARFRADLDADQGELDSLLALTKRQEELVAKGLATSELLEEVALKKGGLEQRVRTSQALVQAAGAHEEQARTRLKAFLSERKRPADAAPEEERVAPARAEALAMAAHVKALEDAVADLSLKAPFDGVVASVPAGVGGHLPLELPAVVIVGKARGTVTVYADQRLARRLSVGDGVVLKPSDHASPVRHARIRALSPHIGEIPERFWQVPKQPSFARVVVAELIDGEPPPLPGMLFDAHFQAGPR